MAGRGRGISAAPAAHHGRAFTLVELLVTVAIAGTLAALLLPALSRTYLTAQVTGIRSDLRQIGIAVHDYWLHFEQVPPSRTYCIAGKRHLYHCLPWELWECRFLDGPLYDPFNPGYTYRYAAVGPGFCNDSPTQSVLTIPKNFPRPGGKMTIHWDPKRSPVRWILWSVGPDGPPPGFVQTMQFNPADPAAWYPHDPRGIVCRYHDGNCGISPE